MANEVNCNEESFLNNNNNKFFSDQNKIDLENNHTTNCKKESIHTTDQNSEKINNGLSLNDSRKSVKEPKKSFWVKIKKNIYLSLAACLLLYLYYVYMNYNIVVISSRTKNNITLRVWSNLENFKEESYFKIYFYTIVFHTLYALMIITLIKTSLTCPGFLDQAYLENFELNEEKCYQGLSASNEDTSGPDRTHENLERSFKDDCLPFKGKEFFKLFAKIENQTEENKRRLFRQLFDSLDSNNALKRVCKFCKVIKPDRSHHCRICRKCVLKFDHHCPLLNNCIGFYNYKFFFLLILYLVLLLIFVLLTSIESLCLHFQELGSEDFDTIFFLVFYILCFVVLLYTSELLIMHIRMIYKGVTTVENLKIENDPENPEFKKNKPETLEETLGASVLTWFIPTDPDLKFGGYLFAEDIERLREVMLNESAQL